MAGRSDVAERIAALAGRHVLRLDDPANGWPALGELMVERQPVPVALYVAPVGRSHRDRDDVERRFQNPGGGRPIDDPRPDRQPLLLGLWDDDDEVDVERPLIVSADPIRRLGRTTRFSVFVALETLMTALDTGWADERSTTGENIRCLAPSMLALSFQADRDGVRPARTTHESQIVERIQALKPSDMVDDVLLATARLGGSAQRAEIIDRALAIRDWSPFELAVPAWWTQAARNTHLRAVADAAVDLCARRGLLEPTGEPDRWRLPAAVTHPRVGSSYRPTRRNRRANDRLPVVVEIDLNELDARTDAHMALQDRLAEMLGNRGVLPRSWRPPEPLYDIAFEHGSDIVVVEVKTLQVGKVTQQMRLGTGQLIEYRQQLVSLYRRHVRAILLCSISPGPLWQQALASADIALLDGERLDEGLDAVL